MGHFVTSQLDYIFFFYGLSFLLLAMICWILSKNGAKPLDWKRLALFGLIHGISEWLDLIALSVWQGRASEGVRLVMLATSFLVLLEFGRSGFKAVSGRGPGRWVLVVLGVLPLGGALYGVAGLNAGFRYGLGLTGGTWSALALYYFSKTQTEGKVPLLLASVMMALYGLAAGVVVPEAGFGPSVWINMRSFSEWTGGIPIHLFRGMLAVGMTIGIWEYCLRQRSPRRTWRAFSRKNSFRFLVIVLFLILGTGGGAINFAERYVELESEVHRTASFESVKEIFQNTHQKAERAARSFAQDNDIIAVLERKTAQAVVNANRTMDRMVAWISGDRVFLMQEDGTCIASNQVQGVRLVGHDFKFRSYFQRALKGDYAIEVVRGIVPNEIGIYVSAPVRGNGGRIIGVVAIKVPVQPLRLFESSEQDGFLVDEYGVVIHANDPRFLSLKGEPIFQARPEMGQKVWSGQIPGLQLTLYYLITKRDVMVARLIVIVLTALLCLLWIGSFFFRQRELDTQVLIAESETRYRSLFDSNAAAMILIDYETGRIDDANPAAVKFYGYSHEQLLGMELVQINTAPAERVREAMNQVVTARGAHFEFKHRLEGGEVRDVEIFATPMQLNERQFLFSIIFDLTDRKKMEKERDDFRAQLYHAEKLASIGTLAAGVGHEVNNPLTIIRGYIEVLRGRLSEQSDYPEVSKILDKQEKAIERITKIINSLRSYSRLDSEQMEAVDLNHAVHDVLGLIEQILSKSGIVLELNLSSAPLWLDANFGKIEQLIMNLLTNARDAVESNAAEKRIAIATEDMGATIKLSVRDNGYGIPAENRERIFDPFYTTKPTGMGTGLGLAICRAITISFGGSMTLTSKVGEGSNFVVVFPKRR